MNKEQLQKNPELLLKTILAYAVNDLEVEPDIKKLLIDNKDLIKNISPERTYELFKSIMVTTNPAKYIREFKEIFFEFIPGLKTTDGFEQKNPWHIYDIFEHTMHVIENTSSNEVLRIAALFHDLGKPSSYTEETKTREDGSTYQVGHFYGHNVKSMKMFIDFADHFHISDKEREAIAKLVLYHDFKLSNKENKIQGYINELGLENIPLLFELKRADNLAQNLEMSQASLDQIEEQEKIYNDYIAKITNPNESIKKTK